MLDKGDADGSLKVIADGLAADPTSKELLSGLAYHTQEALKYLDEKKGTDAAVAHFKELREKFPKVKDIADMGFAAAFRAVDNLADDKKFAEALKAAGTYAPLAGDRAGDLKCLAFDRWGRSLVEDKKWEEALAKYAEGLKEFPKSQQLLGGATTAIDQWAHQAIDGGKKDWPEAIKRYDAGLKVLPDSQYLKDKREICRKQLDKKK